ncbi:MAG: hypothetical protein Q4B80_00495 [Aerococcaceae bacterium]|nr:hypothetical protein [Aerococcaceae bacterium]
MKIALPFICTLYLVLFITSSLYVVSARDIEITAEVFKLLFPYWVSTISGMLIGIWKDYFLLRIVFKEKKVTYLVLVFYVLSTHVLALLGEMMLFSLNQELTLSEGFNVFMIISQLVIRILFLVKQGWIAKKSALPYGVIAIIIALGGSWLISSLVGRS